MSLGATPTALPEFVGYGQRAGRVVYLYSDGTVLPVVAGGSGDDGEPGDDDTTPPDSPTDTNEHPDGNGDVNGDGDKGGDAEPDSGEPADQDRPLGEKGEKALAAEKERRRAETRRRRDAEARAKTAEAELAALRANDQPAPGDDANAEALRERIRAEAIAEAKAAADAERVRERVLDKIEAKAARSFTDPGDAVVMLLRQLGDDISELLDDGKPDVEAIEEALADLLTKKPYLGVIQPAQRGRFKGSADGGAKPNRPPRPTSLGEAVQRTYTPS